MYNLPKAVEREAEWAQSEEEAPFCPDCHVELNQVALTNGVDSCHCGTWWYNYDNKLFFQVMDTQ